MKPNERLIMDTKYKLHYNTSNAHINDIREISGYARDENILKTLGINKNEEFVPPCLIIYPDNIDVPATINANKGFIKSQNLLSQSVPIKSFRKFYKMSISLPIK